MARETLQESTRRGWRPGIVAAAACFWLLGLAIGIWVVVLATR